MPTTHCGSYCSEENAQPLKHVPRLTDLSEKWQQNQVGRLNGRDRSYSTRRNCSREDLLFEDDAATAEESASAEPTAVEAGTDEVAEEIGEEVE